MDASGGLGLPPIELRAGDGSTGRPVPWAADPEGTPSDPSLVGEELEVETVDGTLGYVVDSVTTYEKDTLKDSDIWQIAPDRIVLISCYTRDAVGRNVVVASPAPED